MRAFAVATLATITLGGCGNSTPKGMPNAEDWQQELPVAPMPSAPRGMGTGNPHGGGGDPHGGMMGGDPHAGMMGGGGNSDPHAGVPGAPPIPGNFGEPGASFDVSQLGLAAPDPNRPVDPNRRIRGTLKASPDLAAKLTPGSILYLMVRKPDTAGKPGTLIAVDKLEWKGGDIVFELTERHAMVSGAPDMIGDLSLSARVDQDEDAMTRQPGDVVGQIPVKVPADNVVLVLDKVL